LENLMKLLVSILLVCAVGEAQRGGIGGGGMRGGMGSGGMRGGMGSGGSRGGISGGGLRGGTGPQGVNRGFIGPMFGGQARGVGMFRGSSLGFGLGWGGGWGWGGGLGNYGCPYSYPCSSYVEYPYASAPVNYGYGAPQPAVTVVYPPPVVERATPVTREYDSSGQEIRQSSPTNASPIYLFAFEDQAIRAASAYWVEGRTLHYVTLQREEKQAPLDTLDRALTLQLNRERRVSVLLP
jgi:hypothetical protein